MEAFYNPPTKEERKKAEEICEFLLNFEYKLLKEIGIYCCGGGCEKDVYYSDNLPGWVVKMGNKSCFYEAKNYGRAVDAGFYNFFAPSFFVMEGDSDYPDVPTWHYWFTMQREVICNEDANTDSIDNFIVENCFTEEDNKNIDEGNIEECDLIERYYEDLCDYDNVEAIIGFTNASERNGFIDFCDEFKINDIHSGNFGFSKELRTSVIIDYSGYHNWDTFEEGEKVC